MDELTKHPVMQRWWAFKRIIAALRIGFAIIVAGGMLQDWSTSYALAQELSGVKTGHYVGPPSFYTRWHYERLIRIWPQSDTHGSYLMGEWESGKIFRLAPDFEKDYFKEGPPKKGSVIETVRRPPRIISKTRAEVNAQRRSWTWGSYGGSGIAYQAALKAYRQDSDGYKGLWWNSTQGRYNEAPLPQDFNPSDWIPGGVLE